eukprot:g5473.t1
MLALVPLGSPKAVTEAIARLTARRARCRASPSAGVAATEGGRHHRCFEVYGPEVWFGPYCSDTFDWRHYAEANREAFGGADAAPISEAAAWEHWEQCGRDSPFVYKHHQYRMRVERGGRPVDETPAPAPACPGAGLASDGKFVFTYDARHGLRKFRVGPATSSSEQVDSSGVPALPGADGSPRLVTQSKDFGAGGGGGDSADGTGEGEANRLKYAALACLGADLWVLAAGADCAERTGTPPGTRRPALGWLLDKRTLNDAAYRGRRIELLAPAALEERNLTSYTAMATDGKVLYGLVDAGGSTGRLRGPTSDDGALLTSEGRAGVYGVMPLPEVDVLQVERRRSGRRGRGGAASVARAAVKRTIQLSRSWRYRGETLEACYATMAHLVVVTSIYTAGARRGGPLPVDPTGAADSPGGGHGGGGGAGGNRASEPPSAVQARHGRLAVGDTIKHENYVGTKIERFSVDGRFADLSIPGIGKSSNVPVDELRPTDSPSSSSLSGAAGGGPSRRLPSPDSSGEGGSKNTGGRTTERAWRPPGAAGGVGDAGPEPARRLRSWVFDLADGSVEMETASWPNQEAATLSQAAAAAAELVLLPPLQ